MRRRGIPAICRIAVAALALAGAARVRADPVSRWQAYVDEASVRFGVPAEWIARVMRAESGGRTMLDERPITSPAGAMGLMQLMPETWAEMRARLGLGPDPHAPRDNILAGSFYLRLMYERFGYPGLFAAYNAGPGRYAAHFASGRPMPRETRRYLAAVTGLRSAARPATAAKPANGIFFEQIAARMIMLDRKAVVRALFVPLSHMQPPREPAPQR